MTTDTTPVQSVREIINDGATAPAPEWVRGRCSECGDHLVSNCYAARPVQQSGLRVSATSKGLIYAVSSR